MSDWQIDRISEDKYAYKVDGVLMGYETSFAGAVAKLEEIQRTEEKTNECKC